MKVLFVDDRLGEIMSLWECSGAINDHELLPLEPFRSVERTCELVNAHQPDVIFIGFGLGVPKVTGADVIRALHSQGFKGEIIGNSGGGIAQFEHEGINLNQSTKRNPTKLKEILYEIH